MVAYTGNGANMAVNHNLGVAPEFVIMKSRTTGYSFMGWRTYHSGLGMGTNGPKSIRLDSTAVPIDNGDFGSLSPTSTTFNVNN